MIISYKQSSLKIGATTPKENFWRRVFVLRGMLFSGTFASWELEGLGYSLSEIRTAVSLNEKYFKLKEAEGV